LAFQQLLGFGAVSQVWRLQRSIEVSQQLFPHKSPPDQETPRTKTKTNNIMSFNNSNNKDDDARRVWQAWQAQAKASSAELLSDETIDPIVQAHMTLTPPNEPTRQQFSFVLEECHLSDQEWESHCLENSMRSRGLDTSSNHNGGLALVPLRRTSHS
jgi:hypothetical protein